MADNNAKEVRITIKKNASGLVSVYCSVGGSIEDGVNATGGKDIAIAAVSRMYDRFIGGE